jgi:hypothetical protein
MPYNKTLSLLTFVIISLGHTFIDRIIKTFELYLKGKLQTIIEINANKISMANMIRFYCLYSSFSYLSKSVTKHITFPHLYLNIFFTHKSRTKLKMNEQPVRRAHKSNNVNPIYRRSWPIGPNVVMKSWKVN